MHATAKPLASAIVLALALMPLAGAVRAADTATPQASPSTSQSGTHERHERGDQRADAQEHVADAARLAQQMKADPRLAGLMQQAKGILFVPDYGRGAIIVGGQGGKGVLVARTSDGKWSGPVFYTLGGISIGLQAGAEGGSVAMLLMTDRAVNSFRKDNNIAFNADAGLTFINYTRRAQESIGKGDVVVWSNAKGAYVGASLGATDVNWDEKETRAWYGTNATPSAILGGKTEDRSQDTALRDALPG